MRTLALDIGNTAVKVGCFEGGALREMAGHLTAAQVRQLAEISAKIATAIDPTVPLAPSE